MKTKVAIAGLAIAGIIAGAYLIANRGTSVVTVAPNPEPVAQTAEVAMAAPAVGPETAAASNPAASAPSSPAHAPNPGIAAGTVSPSKPLSDIPPMKINGYVVQDPAARVALSLVGTDPDAEAYWTQAINDPNLPAGERKDLIEDLNEDGLSDPNHPAAEDMPVIANRIQLIEEMAPNATDPVNIAAFKEAYKDLMNLYNGIPPN